MTKMVTKSDLDLGLVAIDVPQGDLLVKVGAALARWQEEMDRRSAEMASLEGAGVFMDDEGTPVVPGWWERKEDGHHVAWYLVWPHKYVRKAGVKRRQYVKAADYEATRAKVGRTLEYANLKARRDKLIRHIEQVGQDLEKLADKFGW